MKTWFSALVLGAVAAGLSTWAGAGLGCLVPTEEQKKKASASILGTWENEVRHAVHASLYQPIQGSRLRNSVVYFKQEGGRLIGYALTPNHDQESWNKEGRTDFREVTFAEGRLVFKFDVAELKHGRRGRIISKGYCHVEAELRDGRLLGRWSLFEKETNVELFRGEWEAARANGAIQ